jgi:hypothetical protein
MMFAISVYLATLPMLICLAAGTNLLRARIAAMPGGQAGSEKWPPAKAPFSLGRLQMAWWTAITLASFVVLAVSRHQWHGVLNLQTVLVLAIAAATMAGSSWVERGDGGSQAAGGFLADILYDDGGLCLHRVQLLLWSLVLGLSFIWTVVTDASMPAFDFYKLAVLAISGCTYVGFKTQETPMKTA